MNLSSRLQRYNRGVRTRLLPVVLMFGTVLMAQSAPIPCPSDRPVDDIIGEIHKLQSKKNNRNKNPLPSGICIFGWCRQISKTPPTVPQSSPSDEVPAEAPTETANISSSKPAADKCNAAMETALEAAHNVEVGDYYFEEKNFKAALGRYQDALADKPDDAAIQVRLGRTFQKLNDTPHAVEHYQAAEKLATPEKWVQEAHDALARLH